MCGMLLWCARHAERGAQELAVGGAGRCVRTAGRQKRVRLIINDDFWLGKYKRKLAYLNTY